MIDAVEAAILGVFVGICAITFLARKHKKPSPRAGVVAVYIERVKGGDIIRNTADDGEMGLRNPENHQSQRMIFVSVKDALSMARGAGWYVDGIIGEVECIKSTIGEL